MPNTAHHCMQRIAQCAFQRIPGEPAVHLHVPDRRLNRTAPTDQGLQGPCDPASALTLGCPPLRSAPAVTPVRHRRLRFAVGSSKNAHLLHGFGQCVAVIRDCPACCSCPPPAPPCAWRQCSHNTALVRRCEPCPWRGTRPRGHTCMLALALHALGEVRAVRVRRSLTLD